MDKALITGSSGMIGKKINFGIKPSSKELDVTDFKSVALYIQNMIEKPFCIIHLASVNLRESEENKGKAIDVNINGTVNMLNIAKQLSIPFILFSSGAVFSSKKQLIFDKNFKVNPNCMYGYTKAASEKVTSLYDKSIIIRTGWLFGGSQKNHYNFVENVINNLLTNTPIIASNDFYGSPTYINDLIDKMCDLIKSSSFGIHHIVNSGYATGYEIAKEICNIMNKEDVIRSVSSKDVPNAGPPQRSNSEMLASEFKIRSWQDALKEYMSKKQVLKNKKKDEIKNWSLRDKCRMCECYDLHIFYNLKPTPPANHFVKTIIEQECIPLDICICEKCKHIQLLQIVNPSYQYSNYIYVSSTSDTMKNHLINNTKKFVESLSKSDNILEIGANDGVCIKYLLDEGFSNTIGVDPAENIKKRHNLPIICDFFGSNLLLTITKKYKLIFGFHCCAHIENINDVFKTVYEMLEEDGNFIIEVGYFYEVFKNKIFDIIYHEHVDYHTCTAIQTFGLSHNLILYNIDTNNIQSGSIQFYFSKNKLKKINENVYEQIEKEKQLGIFDFFTLKTWQNEIIQNTRDVYYILNSLVSYGKKIAGYGASAKSTTFMYECNLSHNIIDYIIDDNIYKQNHFSPGLHIPIKSINVLEIEKVDYIIILSWNFCEEIIKKLKPYGCRIILPFPVFKIF
jgi:dTDP-4-dehydrorhamnose reductase